MLPIASTVFIERDRALRLITQISLYETERGTITYLVGHSNDSVLSGGIRVLLLASVELHRIALADPLV